VTKINTYNTIDGHLYIATLNQKNLGRLNAVLAIGSETGLFNDSQYRFMPELQKSFESLKEISNLGTVINVNSICEDPINYNLPLENCTIQKKEHGSIAALDCNGQIYGMGNLSIDEHHYCNKRLITPGFAQELHNADASKPYFTNSKLFVVRYRDSKDININPIHQIGIIAKDGNDLNAYFQNFKHWFRITYISFNNLIESHLHEINMRGMVVMSENLADFQNQR
jgi:hypothetical protein